MLYGDQMLKLKDILIESTPTHGSEPLDGKSKTNAKNWVLSKINKYTKGFFSDEYWQPIQKVFAELDKQGLNWVPMGNQYDAEYVTLHDGSRYNVPVRKVWTFAITFINNRDKIDALYGRIVASGAGPAESPLDRYDVVITLS